jgi:hypothetical protein
MQDSFFIDIEATTTGFGIAAFRGLRLFIALFLFTFRGRFAWIDDPITFEPEEVRSDVPLVCCLNIPTCVHSPIDYS